MTIDTNELRRLAQAATPGPWYVTGKLTRYVEARIDGGLIQEVAACGPTKADGGYGPQQEANARLIAAANPATVSELLDRLEAAEQDALEQARMNDIGAERELALMAKLEAAERDRATFIMEIGNLCTKVEVLREELSKQRSLSQAAQQLAEVAQRRADALRAKIEQMEKQEPVAVVESWTNGSYSRNHSLQWLRDVNEGARLYALPGAKVGEPAPSVPDVDALAQFIREIDGKHQLGAGALAERIVEWLAADPEAKP